MPSDRDLMWELGERHPGHDYRVFTTHTVDAHHPRTGARTVFSKISAGDWVNIIALTRDQQIVMLRQYRAGTDRVHLEIPGGMVDPGEDAAVAAPRELVEETGYTAKTWRKLGAVRPNPALMDNTLHTFLALDCELTDPPRPDSGEVLAIELRPIAEVQAAIVRGEIDHALVIVAFAHWALAQSELRAPGA